MPLRAPRLLLVAAAFVAAAALPASSPIPTSATHLTVGQAESRMVGLINADRAKAGLVALRTDGRLMSIARARSQDMATYHYFSHTEPDGQTAQSYLTAAGVVWYGWGEIIAWNSGYATLADSANAANSDWMASSGHRAIIMSTGLNYFGIGLATDPSNGHQIWTGVFIKGPDKTGAWARMGAAQTPGPRTSAGQRRISLTWLGGDIRLQVLTAGFYSYQLARKVDSGAWSVIVSATTATSTYRYQAVGHRYSYRVRARDRAGNYGAWSVPISFSI